MGSNAESELLSEVIAVCNDLGHKDKESDNKYILNEKEANNVIRDLIRFLRNDDKHKFTVRKQLGLTNIVANDLIPIVEQHTLEDIPLFDKVLRLLVDLTNPTIILFRQKIPKDKIEAQKYIELQSLLYSYKLSFGSHKKFWAVLAKHLTRILELDDENRQIEDTIMFERVLVLVRNVLHIPIDTQYVGADHETNPQDRLIEVLHSSGINDLILFLSNDGSHQEFCFHLIEIISLMFREQNAEFIAKSISNRGSNIDIRSDFEREMDRKELLELKARDKSLTNSVPKTCSRFNGTYYVKNLKSISNREIIFHKNPENLAQMSFDSNKSVKRKAKNRQPMTDNSTNRKEVGTPIVHKSSPKVRKILFDFCTDFLQNSYNQFMRQIKDSLSRNMSQDNDETYYLWSVQFFMEFNRCNPKVDDYSLVGETMSVQTFHFLQTQIEHYVAGLETQKEDLRLWSKRLHYGLRAYREMLYSLNYFGSVKDEAVRQLANRIRKQIFYEVEYRVLLFDLLKDYNEAKMSKAFLKDLVETNHIFLKMFESYSKTNTRLLVREKIKRKQKKAPKKKPKEKTPPEDIWIEIMESVSDAIQGNIDLPSPDDDITVRAFDATSDKPMDEQKMEVLRRVNCFLRQKSVAEAIALYRDARNCWSGDEDNAFGAPDIPPEDELLSLNEVLMTDFPEDPTEEDNQEEEEEDEELVIEESNQRTREVEVQFSDVINKYCQPNVIQTLGLLLRNYDKNSDETNHCVIKMLHRIAFDCKMHAMLFQLSIFCTFQRILTDPLRNESSSVKELSTFAKYIISKFKVVVEKNKKVFVELLFWKNCREATEVEEGYEMNGNSNTKGAKQLWSEEQELELQVLFEELKDKSDGDKDYIDLILEKMIDETKTRRQLIRQLKQQGLYVKIKPKRVRKDTKKKSEGKDFDDEEDSDIENIEEPIVQNYSDDSNDKQSGDDNNEKVVTELNDRNTGDLEEQVSDNNVNSNNEMIEPNELNAENNIESDEENQTQRSKKKVHNIDSHYLDDSSDASSILQIDETIETSEKRVFEDSDDEEIIVSSKKKRKDLVIEDEEEEEVMVSSEKKRKELVVEDVEEEEEIIISSKRKRKDLVIEDEEIIVSSEKKRKELVIEDSEDEEIMVSSKKKKKRVLVIDDDD